MEVVKETILNLNGPHLTTGSCRECDQRRSKMIGFGLITVSEQFLLCRECLLKAVFMLDREV